MGLVGSKWQAVIPRSIWLTGNCWHQSSTAEVYSEKLTSSLQNCNELDSTIPMYTTSIFFSIFFHTWDKEKEEIITCLFNLVPLNMKLIASTTIFFIIFVTLWNNIHPLVIFWMFAFLDTEHYQKSMGLTDLSRESEWTNNTGHTIHSEPMWKSYSSSQFKQFI